MNLKANFSLTILNIWLNNKLMIFKESAQLLQPKLRNLKFYMYDKQGIQITFTQFQFSTNIVLIKTLPQKFQNKVAPYIMSYCELYWYFFRWK